MPEKQQKLWVRSDSPITLCSDDGVEFNGVRYVPDDTLAYFTFEFSRAFPSHIIYQTSIHPAVIAKSYQTIKNQAINFEHQMAAWNPHKDIRDRVIGHVVDVTFPQGPMGGWTVTADVEKAPAISGLGAIYKHAQGMADLLGQHLTGKRKYSVSMEVVWPFDEAGFAVALPKAQNGEYAAPEFGFTPNDFLRAGFEYVPVSDAPPALLATYSKKMGKVVAQYNGRKVIVLKGGLTNPVHYAGLGVVHFPAEPRAAIQRLLASGENPLETLADAVLAAFPVPNKA